MKKLWVKKDLTHELKYGTGTHVACSCGDKHWWSWDGERKEVFTVCERRMLVLVARVDLKPKHEGRRIPGKKRFVHLQGPRDRTREEALRG